MIDHLSMYVKDLEKAKVFYQALLAPLGFAITSEGEGYFALSDGGNGDLWISEVPEKGCKTHIAFQARDQESVRKFHEAGLVAGGTDNGAPGPRDAYGPQYYAAFILDPEGNNIEVVCHA